MNFHKERKFSHWQEYPMKKKNKIEKMKLE